MEWLGFHKHSGIMKSQNLCPFYDLDFFYILFGHILLNLIKVSLSIALTAGTGNHDTFNGLNVSISLSL